MSQDNDDTLRNKFAIAIIQGMVASGANLRELVQDNWAVDYAFRLSDMMVERSKK